MLHENGIVPTMPMTPANQQMQQNDMFGGNWIWIILIFLLLGRGGRGLFGGDDDFRRHDGIAASPATNFINNDFIYTQQKIDALGQALITQTTQINQTLSNGFGDIRLGLQDLGYRQSDCCCQMLRAVDGVNYNASQNTCTITNAIRDEGRLTRDLINGNTMQNLRDRNTELAGALNNCNQTANINSIVHNAINSRFPYPVPANVVGYQPAIPFGLPGQYDPAGFHAC